MNGYQALAQYDLYALGGNEDGTIDMRDLIWKSLITWVDSNANGFSDAEEISSTIDAGLKSIDLNYEYSDRLDEAGNRLPYWSWVETSEEKGPRLVRMVDVYFRQIG